MLLDLHIRDFILIIELHLSWDTGLTVLTGETGAGKSIIIDALAALLGKKVSAADIIRSGADSCLIEAVFAPTPHVIGILDELGITQADDGVLLSREISRNGRSRCRINGQLATVGALQRLGDVLVDIHSQHESQWLLASSRQLDMLDAYGGSHVAHLRQQVAQLARRRAAIRQEYETLVAGERERARQIDLLRYQVDEIAAAQLNEEEDKALEEERTILANAEQLSLQLEKAYHALYENETGAAADLVGVAVACLSEAGRMDPKSHELLGALQEVEASLSEYAREVRLRSEEVRSDPERLAEVETRLELIERLKRKYGRDVKEVLAFSLQAEAELEQLVTSEARSGELIHQLHELENQLLDVSRRLHEARVATSQTLQTQIEKELRFLGMGRATFYIALDSREAPDGVVVGDQCLAIGESGFDVCEFMFTANPGEEPRPLARVASGGELSRVMLALKTVLAQVYEIPTLIFDEVDAGLGGRTAQAVAQKLHTLAAARQVICVTHLAQTASVADQHIQIEKVVEDDTTRVELRLLSWDERIAELARMLDGTQSTTTLEHARQMLASSQKAPS